jgi:hypothetical protein
MINSSMTPDCGLWQAFCRLLVNAGRNRPKASVSERKLGLDLLRRPCADAERGSYFLRMPASPFSSALRIAKFMAESIVGRPNLLPCRATDS